MVDFGSGTPDTGAHKIQLTRQVGANSVVVTVAGEVDMATARRLDAALEAAAEYAGPTTPLVLELSGTTFLSAAGIHVLLHWHERCAAAGSSLVLTALRRPVAKVLRIANLDTYFTVAPTRHDSSETDQRS